MAQVSWDDVEVGVSYKLPNGKLMGKFVSTKWINGPMDRYPVMTFEKNGSKYTYDADENTMFLPDVPDYANMTGAGYEKFIGNQSNGGAKRKGSLESCTVAELKVKAAKRGVSLKGLTKKCDIIAKLRR